MTSPAPTGGHDCRLAEIRSTGGQTVAPPSVYAADPAKGHLTPEHCVWARWGAPARVKIDELRAVTAATAAAALLGRYWPRGARHYASLALAGALILAGWALSWVEQFVRAVCAAACDEEATDRLRSVRDTAETLAAGDPATGWPTLARLLGANGDVIVNKVREWLGIVAVPATPLPDPPADEPPPWLDPPDKHAFHGPAGELARVVEPASEADPVAVLAQTLDYFGNAIGRSASFTVESDCHTANEFIVLVGQSAKARKGTSRGHVHRVFAAIEPDWAADRTPSGLSSGEGLIWSVRDPVEKQERIKERGEPVRYETVVADPGEEDKRLLVYEPEFANVLKQTERQGNTLSVVTRQAWETGLLQTLTKNSPARATGAHISIIGHITAEELRRYLTATETANGFGNRFIWLAVRRSKFLPEGGRPNQAAITTIQDKIAAAIQFARGVGQVRRDDEARELWDAVYQRLSGDRPGLAGCLLGRAEAHVTRLSLIYALLDRSPVIKAEHLMAALALWDYAERSVLHIFGDSLGDPLADDLQRLLRRAPQGMSRTEISTYLGRNVSAEAISRALGLLLRYGRARFVREETDGRTAERWFACREGGG